MSEENLDSTILAFYDALNRRDLTVVDELASPDVVVEEAPGANPELRTYRGRDGFRAFIDGIFKFWAQVNFEVVRITWADESRAVIATRSTFTGRGSSIELSSDSANLVEFRDGSLVRVTIYRTVEEGLEAAGLGE